MNTVQRYGRVLGFVVMSMALISALMLSDPIQAAENKQPVMIQSAKSFADTVAGIKGAIKEKGLAIIFEANHQNMIAMVGGSTTPSVAIGFAKPQMGQQLLSIEPLAGIEMPMRIAVRELPDGKVYVIYYQPSYLFAHYGNPKLEKLGEKMDAMVAMIAKAGAQ